MERRIWMELERKFGLLLFYGDKPREIRMRLDSVQLYKL
jgi:hypothetical protein